MLRGIMRAASSHHSDGKLILPVIGVVTTTRGLGALVALLGVIVLAGWFTKTEILIQILPQFVPMQFNTALAFLLSGIGLLSLGQGRGRVELICAVLVTLIGGLTLVQYAASVDLGFDQLLMQHYITTETSHPGRMAPNTAVCFSLTGLGLFMLVAAETRPKLIPAAEAIGLVIFALAIMALAGYLVEAEAGYGWGDLTRMALHTSIGFIMISGAIITHVWSQSQNSIASVPLWVPFLLGFSVIVLDLITPLGFAIGIAYIPLVYCSLWFRNIYAPFAYALIATILILLGWLALDYSNISVSSHQAVMFNRLTSIGGVWAVAMLVFLRKRTAIDLLIQEQRYANIYNSTTEGLITMQENGIIESYNPACEKIFGHSAKNVIGENLVMLMPGKYREKHLAGLERYLQTGDKHVIGRTIEIEALHKDGHTFPIELSISEVALPDRLLFSSVIRDISERRQAEERLNETLEDLKHSNEELERFAYAASHDLKSPLQAIDNLTKWLAEDTGSELSDDNRELITKVRGRVERMRSMLDGMLAYSRAADPQTEPEFVSFADMIEDVLGVLHIPDTITVATNNYIVGEKIERMPLQQVFHNIINNAVKHHDKDVGNIQIFGKDLGDEYEFTVSDDGPGISPDYHRRIFEMFQTLAPKSEKGGSGIGLAMVKKILTHRGGNIRVISQEGEGAEFIFTWPKVPKA